MNRTDELRTARIESLVTPAELALRYPVTPGVATHVTDSRRRIEKILNGEDKRLLVIIGPCSIHDLTAAMEYATRLQSLRNQYQSRLEIVMRTYFEKPRTVVGWKGLISDPDLNGSYRVNHGLELARKLLLQVNELGVPTATEFLDMVTGHGLCQSCFRFFNQSGERYFVEYCDISQDLTVDFNRGFFQAIDEFAVRNTVLTCCCVDTRNPQLTELTLTLTTVTVSILTSFDNSLEGNAVYARTRTVVAFSLCIYILIKKLKTLTAYAYGRHAITRPRSPLETMAFGRR